MEMSNECVCVCVSLYMYVCTYILCGVWAIAVDNGSATFPWVLRAITC